MILYQDFSSHLDSSKNMAARGLGFYIENLKNLLVRNHWTDFHIILQKCSFGDPPPRLFKLFRVAKNNAASGRGLFSLYIYIENFKNFLVRNRWTNFNIILQKCSFGDPLPRLFKPFGFVKKHRPRWRSWMHVRLDTRRSRVQPPPRSATFFRGD